jgi:hypothetical protein
LARRIRPARSEDSHEIRGLFYVLISASAFLFGWFLSRLHGPREYPRAFGEHRDDIPNENQPGDDGRKPPLKVAIDSVPPPRIPPEEQDAREERREKNERETLRVAWFTLIALILYSAITGAMWLATKKSADAAKESAEAARQTADTSKAALHFDQRAWVSMIRDDFRWHVGDAMVFPSRYLNNGKTPAKHVHGWITATWMTGDQTPEFIYEPGTGHPMLRSESPLLWASESTHIKLPVYKSGTQAGETMTLTKPMLVEMESGKSYILIHGKLIYDDVFGVNHWITFCDIYPTVGRVLPALKDSYSKCIDYNNLDTNE